MDANDTVKYMAQLAYSGALIPRAREYPRVDRIVKTLNGGIEVIVGTESRDPAPRTIPPGAELILQVRLMP